MTPKGFEFFKDDRCWLIIYYRVINGNCLVDFVTKPNTFIVKQTWQFNPNSTGGTDVTRTFSDLKLLSPDAPDMTKIIPTVSAKENKLMQDLIIADMSQGGDSKPGDNFVHVTNFSVAVVP